MIKKIFLVLAVCLWAAAALPLSHAQESLFKKNNPDIAKYDFTRSYISSFAYLQSLDKRLQESQNRDSKGNVFKFIQWNLDRLGKDNMDLRIAKNYVSKYFTVPNPLMRKVIDTYVYACDQLVDVNRLERDLWQKMYEDNKQGEISPQQDKKFLSDQQGLSVRRKTAMVSLAESAALAAKLMLSENTKEKQATKRLALTSKERDQLLRKLDTYAGDNLDWGMKPGQTYLQGAIAMIREVLEDPTYLSADD
ncbi:MAG: hypothetical protein JNN05_10680 [Candidatus Omnitrophica bacterium]|nr:hypothetical protein [Candidatus Omnitrophota bacterium]